MAVADHEYTAGRALLIRHLAAGRRIVREQATPSLVRWTDAARTGRTYHAAAAERLLERERFKRDGESYTIRLEPRAQTPTYFAQKDSDSL